MRSVLLLRLDGMGDIILFEPVLRALRRARPEARLSVLVRAQYVELGPLLCPDVSWIGTTIDPLGVGPAEAGAQLGDLRQIVEQIAPEIIVACTSRRNWLDAAVASMVPAARHIAFCEGGDDAYFGPQLRSLYPDVPESAFDEIAAPLEEEADWRRNGGLLRQILGESAPLERPQLGAGTTEDAAVLSELQTKGIAPGGYIVCAAAGFANVPIKTWAAKNYAEVLNWLRRTHGLRAVLVGSHSEAGYLEEIARESSGVVWTSRTARWGELAALLRKSRGCLGNDTGVLHLAAAVNTPVVGVFGGGTWPRFIPAGPGAVVVNPLPCFGCGWDCVFGDAPCVKQIAPAAVQTALTAVLERPAEGDCAVDEVHHFLPETAELMGEAARRWRERAAALDHREREFQETVRLASAKDGEIRQLKTSANIKDDEINSLKRETDGKDREIGDLKAAAVEKDNEIEIKDREIASKEAEIDAKEAEIHSKEQEIDAIKASADERDRAAIASAADAEQSRAEAERLREVARIRAEEIEKLSRACAELQYACDERLALIVRLDGEVKALTNRGKAPA